MDEYMKDTAQTNNTTSHAREDSSWGPYMLTYMKDGWMHEGYYSDQ